MAHARWVLDPMTGLPRISLELTLNESIAVEAILDEWGDCDTREVRMKLGAALAPMTDSPAA